MLDPSQIAKLITEDPDVLSEVIAMNADQFYGALGRVKDAAFPDEMKKRDTVKCPKCGKLRDKASGKVLDRDGCSDPDCPDCPADCN